jgi:hypothetical protein
MACSGSFVDLHVNFSLTGDINIVKCTHRFFCEDGDCNCALRDWLVVLEGGGGGMGNLISVAQSLTKGGNGGGSSGGFMSLIR